MQKSNLFVAGLIFLALVLTSCSQTVAPATTTNQPTAIATTEEVKTSGTMSSEVSYANGKASLSVTDSSGGTYKFTQADSQSATRSVSTSTGGTWDYTNAFDVKQFSGNYTGNITAETGIGSLNLEVTQAADSGDTMRPVTEATSFDFTVSGNTFSATIPAVDILVQQSAVKEKIKTATYIEPPFSNTFLSDALTMTVHFYSDKTFRMYGKIQNTVKGEGFSFTENGLGYIGTYEGNPKQDGEVILNPKKVNLSFVSGIGGLPEDIFDSYKRGDSSKTINVKEDDLTSADGAYHQTIVIKDNTFELKGDFFQSSNIKKNEDGTTSFQVDITGDDVDRFTVVYQIDGGQSTAENTLPVSQKITVPNGQAEIPISVTLFIDKDSNGKMDYGTDIYAFLHSFRPKQGYHSTIEFEIKKVPVSFNITGDISQYQNIQVVQGYNRISVSEESSRSIDMYFFVNVNGDYLGTEFLQVMGEDIQTSGNQYSISDSQTISYSDGRVSPSPVTFKIKDKLKEGNKILIEEDTSGTEFRFGEDQDGNLVFYIPKSGSKGAFLSGHKMEHSPSQSSYSPQEALISLTYMGGLWNNSARENLAHQFTDVKENMQDIVEYLENRKKIEIQNRDLWTSRYSQIQ